MKEGERGWVGGWLARVLSLITSQDGQERETSERMLCYAVGWMVGGVENARRRPVIAAGG